MNIVKNAELAAIDIGTNSIRLIICELEKFGKTIVRIKKTKITRLGQKVDQNKKILDQAIKRTIDVLLNYQFIIRERKIKKVKVVATSAVRDASNGVKVINNFEKIIGYPIEIIDGRKEAELSFMGATSYLKDDARDLDLPEEFKKPSKNRFLVVDIGGGSTEFIAGKKGKVENICSLDIGSVRLTERLVKHDPPDQREINVLEKTTRQEIKPLVDDFGPIKRIIGVAGTYTTLAAINLKMENYDPALIHLLTLKLSEIEEIKTWLASIKLADRKKITGLEPRRADVIIAGTIIGAEVLRLFGHKSMNVSERDLLDGLILSMTG